MTKISINRKRTYIRAIALGLSALSVSGAASASCSSESYTGSVCMTAATFCPNGTLEARGQILQIAEYQALYTLLATSYGGDGRLTFGLPDLRGRAPVGVGQGPGLTPVQLGQQRGTENVTQTVHQMPPHSHAASFTANASDPVKVEVAAVEATANKVTDKNMLAEPNTGASPADGVNMFAGPSSATVALAGVSGGTNTGGTVTVAETGGGQSMSVLDPQLGLRFCIVANGAYPPRPEATTSK